MVKIYKNIILMLSILILFISDIFLLKQIKNFQQINNLKESKEGIISDIKISPSYNKQISPLPLLYTDGAYIKRKDTKETVQLKGVTSQAFNYYDYLQEELLSRLDNYKKWNINIVGFYVNPKNTLKKLTELDAIVEWTNKNRIYLFFMPILDLNLNTISESDIDKQISKFDEFMQLLADRYKQEKNILYGFWAEPRMSTWEDWLSEAKLIAKSIREVNPEAPFLMTGIRFGREINIDEILPPFDNVIYDFHDYPWENSADAKRNKNINKPGLLWERLIGKYPILIGEFGGVWAEDFGSDEDINYIRQLLDHINKYKLNYTAYTIDDEKELGLINPQTGKPTRKGLLIKEDLYFNPPTLF